MKYTVYIFSLVWLTAVLFSPTYANNTTKPTSPYDLPARNAAPLSLTPCIDGSADIYPCHNADLLAFMPINDIGGGSANDIWGWTDPTTNQEYVILGRSTGTSFINISNPQTPLYLGNLPAHNNSASTWRDIKVYNNHAFIVSETSGHGMQIFDLTRLRGLTTPQQFTPDTRYTGFGSAHNIVINEQSGFAFGVGTNTCSGGLHFVDITTPTSPLNAGCFAADGYTHDAQCIIYQGPDTTYQNQEICFNSNTDTLTIVDVTTKNAPQQISRSGYPNAGYTHQGWTTPDHAYYLMNDELDELNQGHNTRTRIWDIRDLDSPQLIGIYDASVPSTDHNLYINDNYAYLSNYSSGLRILDTSAIATGNLTEVAYFDTYPQDNNAGFSGSWSNYPFFTSGVIPVSDRQGGLFLIQPTLNADYFLTTNTPIGTTCNTDTYDYLIDISPRNNYTGNVTFSTPNLPPNTTSSITPNPVTVPGQTTLTLNTTNPPANIYTIPLLASDGTISHTLDLTLIAASAPPPSTTLLSPANGATNQLPTPTFSWQATPTAATYHLQIAADPNFNDILLDAPNLTTTTYT
ncbi:MAG TPA: choice-of-anchor B family protein, partial [Anaerolineae bacterium]|nr:choice-of-anchor B family protein [Anaerolineae bacterium]